MSRPTNAQRENAARELNLTYQTYVSAISGNVMVSVKFSSNPRKWFIYADTGHGLQDEHFCRVNVRISACLSPQWLTAYPPRASFLFPATNRASLIAGYKPIPVPLGVPLDAIRLIVFTDTVPGSDSFLRQRTLWGLELTAHSQTRLCGISAFPPKHLPRAIAAAYSEFRQKIAASVANRLLPPNPGTSPEDWAMAYMKSRRVGSRFASNQWPSVYPQP